MSIHQKLLDFAAQCDSNGVSAEDLYCRWANASDAEIDRDGNLSANNGNGATDCWYWVKDQDAEAFVAWAQNYTSPSPL